MKVKRENVWAGCLVGKVLLTRAVNNEGLNIALEQVWRTFKEVKIENLGNNIFMFKFAKEADKRSVIPGDPWHFNREYIVLTEPKGIREITKQSFAHTSFWVQIRNALIKKIFSKNWVERLGR